MKKYFKFLLVAFMISGIVIISCNKKEANKSEIDQITSGKATILIDESLLPIIEDEVAVFENKYDAKFTLNPLSETEAVLALTQKKADILILSRKLNEQEEAFLKNKKVTPKVTKFATDGIALVKSKKSKDTLIDLKDIVDFINGKQNGIKGLVFDNPNSSTVRYFKELAKVDALPEKGIFSFKTNNEVLKYVEQNEGLIGIVGLNWLTQPVGEMHDVVDNIKALSVKNSENHYVSPNQDNIASEKYPLARDLYIINCQGYQGLGIGLAAFVEGEIGQRIILKSGLVPVKIPGRNIVIRNQIEKK
jgi:phosphate transport system substrate-binding protein